MAFNINSSSHNFNSKLAISIKDRVSEYGIYYTSGGEEEIFKYSFSYTSNSLNTVIVPYMIVYDSLYGDMVTRYSLKYHTGRSLGDTSSRYVVKYTSTYPNIYRDSYSLVYTSNSNIALNSRAVFKLRYHSNGASETISNYSLKYGVQFFKHRTNEYVFKYTSDTPYSFLTNVVLLRNSRETSALFYVRGKEDVDKVTMLLSNLPRYQLVILDGNRPNIEEVDRNLIKDFNYFGESFEDTSYYVPCKYILIKGVDSSNNMSLDVYDETSGEKLSSNKSYFFDLTKYVESKTVIGSSTYTHVNTSNSYYNFNYLNFATSSIEPSFKVSNRCCFNNKIKDRRKSRCSPF